MTNIEDLINVNSLYSKLKVVKELVYDQCGFAFTDLQMNVESKEYGACTFKLNEKNVQHRVAKITPTKAGQFVAIWKRNLDGKTVPFDILDNIDFILITVSSNEEIGQFIFPKIILADNGIISDNGKEGKRGIRVYTPWDIVTNKQAEKTQNWQEKYFLMITKENKKSLEFCKNIFC